VYATEKRKKGEICFGSDKSIKQKYVVEILRGREKRSGLNVRRE
jgi:hypothetical protein